MRIAIVTSGDYIYAGGIFLKSELIDYDVVFVDVCDSGNNSFKKKIKLALLFGFFRSLALLFRSHKNKAQIQRSKHFLIIKKADIRKVLLDGGFDIIFLINYAQLFPVTEGNIVINCHPSLLPKYRGLMPIAHTVNDFLISRSSYFETGVTLHRIDERFDMGKVVCQKQIRLPENTPLSVSYDKTYDLVSECLKDAILNSEGVEDLKHGPYYSPMTFLETLLFKIRLLMKSEFFKFMINGGVIGLISWALQVAFYALFSNLTNMEHQVALSVYAAFIVASFINFQSLKRYVFNAGGSIYKFFIITTLMIGAVGVLSEQVFALLESLSLSLAIYFAYPIAAILLAPVSFIFKKSLVFIK